MTGRQYRALNHENIRARLLHQLDAFLGAGGHGRHRAQNADSLDRLDALGDELRLDRLSVDLFEDRVYRGLVGRSDAVDDWTRIRVARVRAVEVEDGDTAEPAHHDREVDVNDSVHRCAPDWNVEAKVFAHRKQGVDLAGVGVDPTGARAA